MNICIFASGKGSNFLSIINSIKNNKNHKISFLITDRKSGAEEIAKENNIPSFKISIKDFKDEKEYLKKLKNLIEENSIELICLSGFLSKLPDDFVKDYYGKIINIHPSLLPSFGGKGFYGEKVHKAVLDSGVKLTGVTIHFVNTEYDKGPIIIQQSCPVYEDDNIETLSDRVLKIEHSIYPLAVNMFLEKRIEIKNDKVSIKENIDKKIKNALISVSDKTNLLDFAKGLRDLNINIIATGGTYKFLKENGFNVISVESLTSFPEILNGRVKTLNNKIFAGILFQREKEKHLKEISENFILPIDILVVNLYPFEEISKKEENWSENLIENIDIGGVALLRAGAKNYKDVAVICHKEDYNNVINEIKEKQALSLGTKKNLALKVFKYTSFYDGLISSKLSEENNLTISLSKVFDLRYGENSHQKASFYSQNKKLPFEKLHGKELSYNNILDIYGSVLAVNDFKDPACVVFKHITPCGISIDKNITKAFENAYNSDSLSAFGGVIALNRKLDFKIAEFISKKFVEIVVAPDFENEGLELIKKKKNIRILKWNKDIKDSKILRSVGEEVLVSDYDDKVLEDKWQEYGGKLTEEEKKALIFAFTCVKHIRSNAIVLTNENTTLGIGAGQMSRVDSVFMASYKYSNYLKQNEKPKNLVMASDAFFPFEDSIVEAKKIGVNAIIQPGGSIRDKEVIEEALKLNIKMVLTGIRHFKH